MTTPRSGIKSLIIYGSKVRLSNAHKLVTVWKQPPYYVRVDSSPLSFGEALNKCKPQAGEVVLNTIPLE